MTDPSNKPHALAGVILAGGFSRRMGQDKASIRIGGRYVTHVLRDRLDSVCGMVVLSNRAGQFRDSGHAGFRQIHDRYPDIGPIGGLLSCSEALPDWSFLVVACDMPFMSGASIQMLVEAWRSSRGRTVVFSAANSDEVCPFPGIYGPEIRDVAYALVKEKRYSIKGLLDALSAQVIPAPDEQVHRNLNCPEDL